MFAIVEIDTKQYLVQKDQRLPVQLLKEKEGKVTFDKVLLVADEKKVSIGTPYLDKTSVEAEIEGQKKDDKVTIYKYRRRKKYRRTAGHRQQYTILKITRINGPSA